MAIGSLLNARLIGRFGLYVMLRFGWFLTFSAGALLFVSHWIVGFNAYAIVGAVMLFYLGSTFIFANTFAGAFAKCGKIAGFAGALFSMVYIVDISFVLFYNIDFKIMDK
jgi:hypothetical protein